MLVKAGVNLSGMHYGLWYAAAIYDAIRQQSGLGQGTITGGIEGADAVGPARIGGQHAAGMAVDLRTRDLPEALRPELAEVLQQVLGSSYRVVLESDHIHVQLFT